MLLTVDINALFSSLFESYGDDIAVDFMPMDEIERLESTEVSQGLHLVRDRFQIFEVSHSDVLKRRPDIEQFAISRGAK
jgi:hypothetical protein